MQPQLCCCLAWTLAIWATPTMTLGHMLFAGSLTLYMAIAVFFEERDLVEHFGDAYRVYQRRVPMFIPRLSAGETTSFRFPTVPAPKSPETPVT